MFAFSATDDNLQIQAPYEGSIWFHDVVGKWWMHRHAELECNLVVRGAARYLMHDRTYILTPGTLVWLFPQQAHLLLEQSPDHCQWTIVVTPHLLERCCIGPEQQVLCEGNPEGFFRRQVDAGAMSRLVTLLEEVHQAHADVARYNAGLAYVVLCLWSTYLCASESNPGLVIHPSVERAIQLMTEHPELRVGQLAVQCGLSASQLGRVFHAQIGMPLVRFRNRQMLARFFQVYSSGHLGLQQAALEAGFGSYSQFHRIFTDAMHNSPAMWQQAQKQRVRGAASVPEPSEAAI